MSEKLTQVGTPDQSKAKKGRVHTLPVDPEVSTEMDPSVALTGQARTYYREAIPLRVNQHQSMEVCQMMGKFFPAPLNPTVSSSDQRTKSMGGW